MKRFSPRHNSPVVAHPLMHALASQPASPAPPTPGSAAAMSAAAISPLTAAFAAAAGAASGLAARARRRAAARGSPGGGSHGSATPLRRMGSISRAGSFGPDPSPLHSSSNSLREV